MSEFSPEATKQTEETLHMQPVAVVALRSGDCSLYAPVEYRDEEQRAIFDYGLDISSTFNIPLIVPKGLEDMVSPVSDEVRILPVFSRTNEKHTMKATKKYFKAVTKTLVEQEPNEKGNETEDNPVPIYVVAHRVSIGAIHRHCEKANLAPVEIIDCFTADRAEI